MEVYSLISSIFLAFGLSAACGFRIFIPPLTYGLLYKADLVQLGEGWDWIGNDWVIAVLALAALIEIIGNLVPWLDNLLDLLVQLVQYVYYIMYTNGKPANPCR